MHVMCMLDKFESTSVHGMCFIVSCLGYFYLYLLCICRPDWLQRINAYRVEASWKLGQWTELETYLKSVNTMFGLIRVHHFMFPQFLGVWWEQKLGCELRTVVTCSKTEGHIQCCYIIDCLTFQLQIVGFQHV